MIYKYYIDFEEVKDDFDVKMNIGIKAFLHHMRGVGIESIELDKVLIRFFVKSSWQTIADSKCFNMNRRTYMGYHTVMYPNDFYFFDEHIEIEVRDDLEPSRIVWFNGNARPDIGTLHSIRCQHFIRNVKILNASEFYNLWDSTIVVNKKKAAPVRTNFFKNEGRGIMRSEFKAALNGMYGAGIYKNEGRGKRMEILSPNDLLLKESFYIKKVIKNDPALVVFWKDGSKTVVKAAEGEAYDPEKGLAMAITKKVYGNNYKYYDHIKRWIGTGSENKPEKAKKEKKVPVKSIDVSMLTKEEREYLLRDLARYSLREYSNILVEMTEAEEEKISGPVNEGFLGY